MENDAEAMGTSTDMASSVYTKNDWDNYRRIMPTFFDYIPNVI
jgi:hypothetical protein